MRKRISYLVAVLLALSVPMLNAPAAFASSRPSAPLRAPANASTFSATARNTTALGSIPSGHHRGQATVSAKEVLRLRTAFASVFAQTDGTYQELVSAAPIHYKDASGGWQNIDNTLVASSRKGYAATNKANSWTVDLPASLTQPIWFTATNGSASFQPVGAAAVAGTSSNSSETYPGAWPGVSLAYRATSTELKESITLGSAAAAGTPLSFAINLPSGESIRPSASGTIQIVNAANQVVFTITAPYMEDANFGKPAGTDSLSMKVSLNLRQDATGTYVDVVPDKTWLLAANRAWPVTIDPSFATQPSNDCEIATTTSSALCPPSDVLQVGNYNAILRTLLQFNPSMEWAGTVLNAQVGLYMLSGSSQSPIEVHALSRSWTNQVTWNTYDGTQAWTNPGGDFNSSAEWTCCSGMTSGNWYTWDFTNLAQNWLQGKSPELGLILKNANEGLQLSVSNFATTGNANSNLWPYLRLIFSPNMGLTAQYTQDTLRLTDHSFSSSNIGNGNELIGLHLFGVRGVGMDLNLDAHWNDFFYGSSWDLGFGWGLSTGYDVGTDTWDYPDGAIFYDSTGQYYRFALNGSNYVSPPGINATFVNAGGGNYTLTYHATSETLTFNSGGWLTKDADRNGNAITFLYDANGALSSITDTEGRVTTFSYNATGNCGATASGVITTITDSASRAYSFTYDFTNCLLLSYTDPQNGPTKPISFAYDSSIGAGVNLIKSVTDNKGNVTKYTYFGSTATDVGWIENVSRVYDALGDAYTTTFVDGVFPQNLSYAGTQAVYDANNSQWRYSFDANNLLTQKIDPLGHSHSLAYDGNYDLTQATDALNHTTNLTYDSNFNLTNMQFPPTATGQTPASVRFGYQAPGQTYLPSSTTDALGNCGAITYDPSGNLTYTYSGQTNPCDGHTGGTSVCDAYEDNASGTCGATSTVSCPGAKHLELCWAQDGDGHRTTFAYDTNGNLVTVTPPSPMRQIPVTVDSISRTTSIRDGNGQLTTFSYDQQDRVVQILYAGATSCTSYTTCTTFSWDADGNLSSRTDVTGTTNLTYDKLNRLVTKSLPDATTNCSGQSGITTSYDAVDNLTQYCDSGGTVTFGYDAANRNTSVAEPGGSCSGTLSLCTTLGYDNDNRLTTLTFPGGAVETVSYDNAGNKTSVVGRDSQARVLTNFTYVYTQGSQDVGSRVSMTENDPLANLTTTYTYDALGRLAQATNTQATLYYRYDGAGNRCRTDNVAQCQGASDPYQYNGANEITASPGVGSYIFDYDGNLTGSSTGGSLAYNAKNQTTAANWGGYNLTGIAYAGVGQSERTAAGSNAYASSFLGLAISKASGASTYFVRDAGGGLLGERTADGNHWYYLTDALGSIAAVMSGSGSTIGDTYSYDPYGKQTHLSGSVSNPWGFAGGYEDPTGLVLFGQRYYDPILGRFTQIESSSLVPDFTYAADNPVNFSDPSGSVMVCDCASGGGSDNSIGGGAGWMPPRYYIPRWPVVPNVSPNRNPTGQGRIQSSFNTTPATDIQPASGTFTSKGKAWIPWGLGGVALLALFLAVSEMGAENGAAPDNPNCRPSPEAASGPRIGSPFTPSPGNVCPTPDTNYNKNPHL